MVDEYMTLMGRIHKAVQSPVRRKSKNRSDPSPELDQQEWIGSTRAVGHMNNVLSYVTPIGKRLSMLVPPHVRLLGHCSCG